MAKATFTKSELKRALLLTYEVGRALTDVSNVADIVARRSAHPEPT